MDDPWPTPANTGAAPRPPAPPTPPTAAAGPTSPAKPAPKPPRSVEAVAGPASVVNRPPPPMPIKSDSAEVKFPTSSSGTEVRLVDKKEPLRKDVRPLMRPVSPPDCAVACAGDATLLDSEEAAAPTWLADSVSW